MRWAFVVALTACSERFTPLEPPVDAQAAEPPPIDASTERDDHDAHDGGACETIGRTGGSDTCLLFEYCGHRHFELDCSARFTCVCSEPEIDGGATKQIAAEPIYCESPVTEISSAFAAARRACAW